jgi:16S rRNA (uracil1498-N3)-methyltransferase
MTLRLPLEDLAEGERDLGAEATRYLLRVRRLRTGDHCVVFDPVKAQEADLEIVATAAGKAARVRLSNLRAASLVAHRSVTLIYGLAKGSKVESVVRDATELGATRIIVARCERSVKRDADVERCRRIALEAARQSGRGDLPVIEGPTALEETLQACSEGLRIILTPNAPRTLSALTPAGEGPLVLAIGPEGGFSPVELDKAERAGFVAARLGRFVLRTETACAAAMGVAISDE